MDEWSIAILVYTSLAAITLMPTLFAIFKGVKPHPGGNSFNDSPHFSNDAKELLIQHYSRISGTLGFWKMKAEIFRRLHYYTLIWTIPASVLIPFLVQAIDTAPASRWLVTIISAHSAILLAFHKALKVDDNFRSWREGESNFYDLYRRMLDQPRDFGLTEDEQLKKYFKEVEKLRMFVRSAELNNTPSIEDAKKSLLEKQPPTNN